ncbi:hypothetical protein K450DRAFT_198073 [Umbelopsis ramanniana AG]|uniref:D-isomer specific 2-hydroxyacid dehydrogenase NAD-binding domain-containing protein n=1 Tax=Umbelopsis ramanniana AG TaxID=1314678 RepID=A0AAD5ECR2_UMBRA|nr:uncharacterized protein K450DRAFT_198073 [Umbelopsis ramanniana AG]KAI8581017.1 hypothetical protein K450DRAFT_198073 [Umbelopsis ramanniana AG]
MTAVNRCPHTLRAFFLGSASPDVKHALDAANIQLVESHYSRIQDIVLASQTCHILLINQPLALSLMSALTTSDHWMAVAYLNGAAIQEHNIPVFVPRPASSRVTARSEAEFVIGNIFQLARVSPRHTFEIRSKTLGIVGYGSVGIQISSMAEALGMRVVFYDSADVMNYGRAKSTASLSELLEQSDFVTLHVPANTEPMLRERELCQTMRKGSYLIDSSHSRAVDYTALVTALKEGHIAGASVDIPLDSSFRPSLPNLLLSHNVRHATQEVADAVAKDVLADLSLYLDQFNVPLKTAFHEDRGLEQPIPQPTLAK